MTIADGPGGLASQRPAFRPYAYVIFVLLFLAAVVTLFVDSETAAAVATVAMIGVNVTAAVMFIRKAGRLDPRERTGWLLIGVAVVIAVIGIVVVGIRFTVSESPVFGWHDLFFFAMYGFLIAGVAALPHVSGTSLQRTRIGLDGLIGAVSMGVLAWVLILSDVIHVLETASPWERVVGSMYPFLDFVLLTVAMIVTLRRSTYRFDVRLLLVTTGLVALSLGDLSFLVAGVGKSFEEATPFFPFHLLAAACFFATASIVDRVPAAREYAERRTPLWAMVMPYGAAAVMLTLLVASVVSTRTVDQLLFFGCLTIAGLVIIRQVVAIRENRVFIERQRNALVSSISHELRTPLTSMVGFLDLLLHGEIKESRERQEMTGIVHQQASYMARIVSDLVMLARGNPDEIEREPTAVRVRELIEASVTASGLEAGTVEIRAREDLVAAVDGDRLQQVLVNLLANSFRYGGEHRLVAARAVASDLTFEVHDDGPGVPKKYELVIWDRFERGPNRLNASVPGSGIGLAIVDAIARAHGGAASYRRSDELGGACFSVHLPGRVLAGVGPVATTPPPSVAPARRTA
jgi:signal transduction histidine kinase